MFNWVHRFTSLLLIALILPIGSVSAQTQPSGLFEKQSHIVDPTNASQAGHANSSSLIANNLIQDPSFEASYGSGAYWNQSSTNFGTPVCPSTAPGPAGCGNGGGTAGPRTGSAWVWFGGTTLNEYGIVSQSVTLPAGCTATLQFYLWIGAAAPGSDAGDSFAVLIDLLGPPLFQANATQIGSYPTYTLVSVDISAYADGTPHEIDFVSGTNGQLVTFNLDDVQIQECKPLLVNSVLPTSRSVPTGTMATIFNTVINGGTMPATGITLSMNPAPAGTFVYQQTNCATNAVIGPPNPALNLAPGGVLCYVLSFTPSAAFPATSVHIVAQATNASATNLLTGINTWLLRSTAVAGPDVIALTTTTDFHQISCSTSNAFAVALSNVGAAATGDITATANTGLATLPIAVSILETDPGTGAIIGDNILQNVGAGENRTVGVFVAFNGCIPFDPAANRIFIEFRDAANNVVGSTSTAVSTNR
jgi:hypothetical protein